MSSPPSMGRGAILPFAIKDRATLYACWMPFVKNGGLFIPTLKPYRLGDEVFILLSLLNEPEQIPLTGKVVWITPPGSQGHRKPGIGVQLGANNQETRSKIETLLTGLLNSDRSNYTM